MKLKFKDGITAEIFRLSCKTIFEELHEYKVTSMSSLRTKYRRCHERKAYVFIDPVKMFWTEGDGPKRWTNKDAMLPIMHYKMLVIADPRDKNDWKTPSYGKCLTVDWLDEEPRGDISLDSILQRAASVVEYSKYST